MCRSGSWRSRPRPGAALVSPHVSKFQEVAFLADVPTLAAAERGVDARRFVDVAAKKVLRLLLFDEVPDGAATEMLAGAGAIEISVFRRAMANQDERFEIRKGRQALGQFCFGIFAGRVERSRVGAAESGNVIAGERQRLAMQIVKAVALGKFFYVRGRFVIARQEPHLIAALGQDFGGFVESPAPVG